METITFYEEYRLIEKSESEVNGAWKGAHLLLFFLAFVFGSFCTFCFHMLMYFFDEQCVLFPKLLSLTSLRKNIIDEFIPEDKEISDMLLVDFLSTQWVDKSACYLPTYVPLLSGIFGLVWTTMFLMCSTGSRTLTGLQRPWRVLFPVFVFSLAMGALCLYVTIITHNGLQELCVKLGEITGSSTCTYTVNVATLAYERRIRGVYQATRITILSAWLHTACWLLSALLTIARVLLAVDFQLIKVKVQLKGNIDRMLERHEKQIRTVSPDTFNNKLSPKSSSPSQSSVKVHFNRKEHESRLVDTSSFEADYIQSFRNDKGEILFKSSIPLTSSNPSLVTAERHKLDRAQACSTVPQEKQFIVKIIYDLIDTLDFPASSMMNFSSPSMDTATSDTKPLIRHYGRYNLSTLSDDGESVKHRQETTEVVLEMEHNSKKRTNERFNEYQGASTSKQVVSNNISEVNQILDEKSFERITLKRELNLSNVHEKLQEIDDKKPKKSNLKNKSIQTETSAKNKPNLKVQITESRTVVVHESSEIGYKNNKSDRLTKEKKD